METMPVKTVGKKSLRFIIVINLLKAFERILYFLVIFKTWSFESVEEL